MSSTEEYQQVEFWNNLEKQDTQYLTIKEIIEKYNLTEKEVEELYKNYGE